MSNGIHGGGPYYKNYINGEWVASSSGESFPVYDPSTENCIARVTVGDSVDVGEAGLSLGLGRTPGTIPAADVASW